MKINGFRSSHRNRWILLSNKYLSHQEFLLFEYFIDQLDFDSTHNNFQTFELNLDDLKNIFGKSTKTIQRWFKELKNKGLIIQIDETKGIYTIHNSERYFTAKKSNGKALQVQEEEKDITFDKLCQIICPSIKDKNVQNVDKNVQNVDKNVQSTTSICRDKNIPNSRHLISSKVKSNRFPKEIVLKNDPRSYEQCIEESKEYETLTADDIYWINQNVTEKRSLEDNEIEIPF